MKISGIRPGIERNLKRLSTCHLRKRHHGKEEGPYDGRNSHQMTSVFDPVAEQPEDDKGQEWEEGN